MLFSGTEFIDYGQNFDSQSEDEDDESSDPRVHAENVSLKEIFNYSQNCLRSRGVYLLDFESEVFVWIGADVKATAFPNIAQSAGQAIRVINPKGRARIRKITLSFVW